MGQVQWFATVKYFPTNYFVCKKILDPPPPTVRQPVKQRNKFHGRRKAPGDPLKKFSAL
jgi:hypothetical protein